jgi:hypothetical protein
MESSIQLDKKKKKTFLNSQGTKVVKNVSFPERLPGWNPSSALLTQPLRQVLLYLVFIVIGLLKVLNETMTDDF